MGVARSALRRSLRGPVQTQRHVDKVLDGQPSLAPKHETTKDLLDTAKQGKDCWTLTPGYTYASVEEYWRLMS